MYRRDRSWSKLWAIISTCGRSLDVITWSWSGTQVYLWPRFVKQPISFGHCSGKPRVHKWLSIRGQRWQIVQDICCKRRRTSTGPAFPQTCSCRLCIWGSWHFWKCWAERLRWSSGCTETIWTWYLSNWRSKWEAITPLAKLYCRSELKALASTCSGRLR